MATSTWSPEPAACPESKPSACPVSEPAVGPVSEPAVCTVSEPAVCTVSEFRLQESVIGCELGITSVMLFVNDQVMIEVVGTNAMTGLRSVARTIWFNTI